MSDDLGLGMLGSLIKGALFMGGLVVGIPLLIFMFWPKQKKESPVPCNCTKGIQFIKWHEKRIMFIDRLRYPTQELTNKQNLLDSIDYYTNLIQTK